MKRLQHWLEFALVRTLFFVLDALPLGAAVWCGERVGDLAFLFQRSRRRTAIENVTRSGIADGDEARRIARASFQHFAALIVESLKSGQALEQPDQVVEWRIPESVERLFDEPGRGVILASGHLGSWEIAAQLLSQKKPVMGITRKMNNPLVEKLVLERKPRDRFYLTAKHEADTGRFLACLKRGHVLALMIDQYARGPGVRLPFFGRPTKTSTSIALLHLVTRTPIVFGYCERIGPMKFRFCADEPIEHARTGDKDRDIREVLGQLHHRLERAIRTCPQQYMWGHRRWRPADEIAMREEAEAREQASALESPAGVRD